MLLPLGGADAQLAPQPEVEGAVAPAVPPESFEIGLSTDTVVITSSFSGTRLVVFGALDDADGRIRRQGGYDIVVALEGPKVPIVVREKERVLGLWVNRGSERFDTAPVSYALAATKRLSDIAPDAVLEKISVGIDHLRIGAGTPEAAGEGRDAYAAALRRIRSDRGLYNQTFGTVEFVSPTLFRAELSLPANLPVGKHQARAFLFRAGTFVAERGGTLWVVKSGFENRVFALAKTYGFLYGVFAVALAIFTGWLGRLMFKRD
ncbi:MULTISPECIES: TIGR02186 family protein [unclassified Aureimonas]|uniref:TIGR02186 family protein n=1 Tax=unclassified Aureimonas TaxID=2615206 RepID=UPI0009E896A8|nr:MULTISPECIES: TIGR02186 family protein [unclassified Aureimonas]